MSVSRAVTTTDLLTLLADAQRQLSADMGVSAIETLCQGLAEIHAQFGEKRFRDEVIPVCRSHDLFSWIQQDPYSRRAFEKPRGYAGDAAMLDYIYDRVPDDGTSKIGCAVFDGTTGTSNGQSVFMRRQYLASLIDVVASRISQPRIASLAAGHLREADLTCCLHDDRLASWTAIDQDAQSLERIRSEYGVGPIETIHGSVTDLIRNKLSMKPVDLFYSAGLFDYLNERLAAKTIASMFERLRPGGELVVSNFRPRSAGRSFMEAFMDWRLVYRDEAEMFQLNTAVPQHLLAAQHCTTDPPGNIIYLHLVRRIEFGKAAALQQAQSI